MSTQPKPSLVPPKFQLPIAIALSACLILLLAYKRGAFYSEPGSIPEEGGQVAVAVAPGLAVDTDTDDVTYLLARAAAVSSGEALAPPTLPRLPRDPFGSRLVSERVSEALPEEGARRESEYLGAVNGPGGLHLDATLTMSGGGVALINGQAVSLGETVEEWRVERIGEREVEMSNGPERAVLRMPEESL